MHIGGCRIVRWLRRIVAIVVLAAMIGLFVCPTVAGLDAVGWLPQIQLVPAVAAGSVLVLIGIAVSVALCGRLYCSTVCPLGILQDVFRAVVTLGERWRIPGSRPIRPVERIVVGAVRIALLLAFVASAFFGLFAWLAPYGIFGRAAASFSDGTVTAVEVLALGQVALILFITLARGRFWCNAFCPVGTFLGLFSRFAVFRVRIDRAKCVNCKLCVRACPNGCIPPDKEKNVDHSRCVSCFACAGICGKGALTWR